MTKNFDVQLGITEKGEHIFSADEVPGVGQLQIIVSTQMLHELAAIVAQASLEAKGYEELRVQARDIQLEDHLTSFPGLRVQLSNPVGALHRIMLNNGAEILYPATSDVRVIRAIQ